MIFGLIFFGISLSIDALGIGLSYGVRKMKIPILARGVLFLLILAVTGLAVLIGSGIIRVLPPLAAKILGGASLILLGFWIFYQVLIKKEGTAKNYNAPDMLLNLLIKPLGIAIQVIRHPEACDLDSSNTIDPIEALYLGAAISIDAAGTGIAGAALGLNNLLLPFVIAFFHVAFLSVGQIIGGRLVRLRIKSAVWSVISGSLLILIGLCRIFL